jgi:hypothetical protein
VNMESSSTAIIAGAVLNESSAPNSATGVAADVFVNNPGTDTLPVPKHPVFNNTEQSSLMISEPTNEGSNPDVDRNV